jgi:ribonuclease HI
LQAPEIVLFTDGASRGNPGLAGAGILITDPEGNTLVERSVFLGETTNNVAEYQALVIGLEEALKLSPKRIIVRMDSELIVKQINGEYRVRNPGLLPHYRRASEILSKLEEVQVCHVRRECNRQADRLANLAIDHRDTTH